MPFELTNDTVCVESCFLKQGKSTERKTTMKKIKLAN